MICVPTCIKMTTLWAFVVIMDADHRLRDLIRSTDVFVDRYVILNMTRVSVDYSADLISILDYLTEELGSCTEESEGYYVGDRWQLYDRHVNVLTRNRVLNEVLHAVAVQTDYLLICSATDSVVVFPDMKYCLEDRSMIADVYYVKRYTVSTDTVLGQAEWTPIIYRSSDSLQYIKDRLYCTADCITVDYVPEICMYTVHIVDSYVDTNDVYSTAELYRLTGRYDEAIDLYRRRILMPDMLWEYSHAIYRSYHGLSICSLALGDHESFEYYLRTASVLYGENHIEIWYSIILYYCNRSRLEDALSACKYGCSLVNDSRCLYLLCMQLSILYRLERYSDCLQLCLDIESKLDLYEESAVLAVKDTIDAVRRLCDL